MGEAKMRQAAAGPMPSAADMHALASMSARFASALLQEGRALPGPNSDQTARMLALMSAALVLARLGLDEKSAAAGMVQALRLAERQEIIEAGRKMIADWGGRG